MLAVVKNPGEVRARTGFLHQPHRSESTALSTQPNPHFRASSNSKIIQFRIRVHCSQIKHASSYQKLQCRLTAPCVLVACDGALQRKKINTDDHLSMCNCSGGTELDKAVNFRISQSAWCTFSRVEQIRGYVPRVNEHRGAHFRGWCANSRANLCTGVLKFMVVSI